MADDNKNEEEKVEETKGKSSEHVAPVVDWDDSEMESSHANVVNASSTREEINIFFGTNETWKTGESREFHVKLNNRIVVSPYCAKRLVILLGAVVKQYENRFGTLEMTPGGTPAKTGKH